MKLIFQPLFYLQNFKIFWFECLLSQKIKDILFIIINKIKFFMTTISNQPNKGEIYYGVRLYKEGNLSKKYLGSHDGTKRVWKIQYFAKVFFDMFIDELKQACDKSNIKCEIVEKQF